MTSRFFDRPMGGRPGSPILPTKNISPRRSPGGVGFPKRYVRVCFLVVFCLFAFAFFHWFDKAEVVVNSLRNPPLYERYHEYEANLPQHNLDLPYPEGRDAKFFWASNHVTRTFWALTVLRLNSTMSRFWLGKCHAGASSECPSGICDKTSVGVFESKIFYPYVNFLPVSCSITLHGIEMVQNIQVTMGSPYRHGYRYLP